jgi:hypothetical protein
MKNLSVALKSTFLVVTLCVIVSYQPFYAEQLTNFLHISRSAANSISIATTVLIAIQVIFKIAELLTDRPKRKRKNDELVGAVNRLSDQPFELETRLPADELHQSGASR